MTDLKPRPAKAPKEADAEPQRAGTAAIMAHTNQASGRRRAGFALSQEPQRIEVTEEQMELLMADPTIVIRPAAPPKADATA